MLKKDKNESGSKKNTYRKLIIWCLILFVGGPLLIHILFKLYGPAWIVAEWSAGDFLQFYGTVVAAIAAVIGLFYTFRDNREGIKEQSRLDKIPFIGVIELRQDYNIPIMMDTNDEGVDDSGTTLAKGDKKYYYHESRMQNIYCVIENGKTSLNKKLTDDQLNKAQCRGFIQERAGNIIRGVDVRLFYLPFSIENIGNGPAIDLKIGVNNVSDITAGVGKYKTPFSLKPSDPLSLVIYAENQDDGNCGEYAMEFFYKDIFGNSYKQSHKFTIREVGNGQIKCSIDCRSDQRLIEDYLDE